jgi:acetylglutamate kinase
VRSDARLLEVLIESGYLPVVACVAGDRQGRIYNVNADQMAVACAVAFRAERLFFLTDVDGVRDARGEVLPLLRVDAGERLIHDGVATGGMQAKLNAAHSALREGIAEVVIAPGGQPGVLSRLLAGEQLGTRLVA